MPIFTDDDWSSLGADLADLYDGNGTVYRAATVTGGTVRTGTMMAVGTALMSIYTRRIQGTLFTPAEGLGGGRVNWEASVYIGTDVRVGDEIRARGERYKVTGAADLRASIICSLEELRA